MMSDQTPLFDGKLTLSRHLDYFRNGEDFYVYHNLFGFILKMSEDVVGFMEYFHGQHRTGAETSEAFKNKFGDEVASEFANVLAIQRCLVDPAEEEEQALLQHYPTLARWVVYEQPVSGNVTLYAIDHATKEHLFVAELDAWDSDLWRRIDGEKTCEALIEELRQVPGSPVFGLAERFFASLGKLSHHTLQAVKLSAKPMSTYRGKRHGTPPYLLSNMPYERITDDLRGGEAGLRVSVPGQRHEQVAEALLDADEIENTLAFLFREPHPGLKGQAYGQRLIHHILSRDPAPTGTHILEIGGGTGHLAASILDTLRDAFPDRYLQAHYMIFAPDQETVDRALATIQAAGHADKVEAVFGDPEQVIDLAGPARPFDIIFCNEYAARLETIAVRRVTRASDDELDEFEDDDTGVPQEIDEETGEPIPRTKGASYRETPPEAKRDIYIAEGNAVATILRLNLPLQDASPDFNLNVGLIRLTEKLLKLLAADGQLFLIEFGEMYHYPVKASDGEHETFSVHFVMPAHVAKQAGFEVEFGYLMEALDFDRERLMLASTRSHFVALRHLLSKHNLPLLRRAYDQDSFTALLRDAGINPDTIHSLTYEKLEDRVLGLVPHSFKLLRVYKARPDVEL
jgi:hypothetical protein